MTHEPRAGVLVSDAPRDSVVAGRLGVAGGDEVLVYVQGEGYFIWRDRDLYAPGGPNGQIMTMFRFFLRQPNEWHTWERLASVLWPQQWPAYPTTGVQAVVRRLGSLLIGTSARIESARDYHMRGYGYRLAGKIEVI
jgi:hypothetical protein